LPITETNSSLPTQTYLSFSSAIEFIESNCDQLPCNDEIKSQVRKTMRLLQNVLQTNEGDQPAALKSDLPRKESNFAVDQLALPKQYRSVEVQTRETMLKVHMLELPNECLALIFSNIAQNILLTLRMICTR